MPNNKTKKHRTIQYVFKISTIIIICGLIVLLLPKIEGFKYSYQKGMPWKYETLIAPLDFPLHKSAEELAADIEKIKEEQAPIFNFKETNIEAQINKLSEKIPIEPHTTEKIWIKSFKNYGKFIPKASC